MPFTLAHPAAVLPIWWPLRRWLPLSALAIGAMVPDAMYFLALQPTESLGHTPVGVLLEGIPSGLALCALWQWSATPLIRALPAAIAGRLDEPRPITARGLPGIIVALALGAATHLLWDSFTHATGAAVQRWSVLSADVGPLPLYKLLQYGGGVVGLLVLVIAAGVALSRQPIRPVNTVSRRWAVWLVVLIGSAGVAAFAALRGDGGLNAMVVRAVIGAVSGGAHAALLAATIIRLAQPDVPLREGE